MYLWICACKCRYLQRTSSAEYPGARPSSGCDAASTESLEEQQVLLVADSPSSSLSHHSNFFVVITVSMCGGKKRRDKVTERQRARANTHVSQYL